MQSNKKPYRAENYNEAPLKKSLVAKKDWHIFQPPNVDIKIKKDEPIPDNLDPKYYAALKSEGVID